MVTKPSHKLFLSYPSLNQEGKSLKPSYFLEQLKTIFPCKKEEETEKENEPQTFEEARLYAARFLPLVRQNKAKEEDKLFLSALLPLLKEKNKDMTAFPLVCLPKS